MTKQKRGIFMGTRTVYLENRQEELKSGLEKL